MLPTTEDIAQLYRLAPYLPLDLQGWHYDQPIFEQVIAELKPRLIIEVGSWKGASAVHMMNCCIKHGLPNTQMYCVDYFNDTNIGGYKAHFDLFLSNVRQSFYSANITPLRGYSTEVAKQLEAVKNFQSCSVIYIDADHTEESCYNDLAAYWPLLRPGGVLLGDDYHEIPSVKAAVTRFCSERKLTAIDAADGYHYRINK